MISIWSGGWSCGTELLTSGIWCYLWVDSVRIRCPELSYRTFCWCLWIVCEGRLHAHTLELGSGAQIGFSPLLKILRAGVLHKYLLRTLRPQACSPPSWRPRDRPCETVCIHAHVHSSLCEEEQRFLFHDKGIPVLRRLRTTLGLIPPLSTPLPPPHVSTCPLITVVFSGLLSCLFLPVLYSISHKAASNLKTLTWCHIQLCICWGNTLTETACSG